jgi:uncharacterized membrane protein (DUF106 family)
MSYRFFGIIIVISIISQIAFSIYYSGEIINQNNLLLKNQETLTEFKKNQSQLQKQAAQLNSMSDLSKFMENKSYVQIGQEININLP